jgi:predicted DNA-binding transcriptional regulator YafY
VKVVEQLCAAIGERLVLTLEYRGSIGTRLIEPHAVGTGAAGEKTLLAWQLSGPSASGTAVGWKNFRLSRIRSLQSTGAHFEVRSDYSRSTLQFSKVICHL